MKKFLLMLVAVLSISTVSFAGVDVQLNGEIINFTDSEGRTVNADLINDRTMVPLRKIFELLGATVEWDNDTSTAFATKGDVTIKLQIDNSIAEVTENGVTRQVELDSKPILLNDRTLVPLRFVSQSLGKQVAWDQVNQTAIIIDYDYFLNRISQKSPALYRLITKEETSITRLNITRNYYDMKNSAYNTTSNIYGTIHNNADGTKTVFVDFDGTSELFKEITAEGWNSIDLNVVLEDKKVSYSTTSSVLNNMLKNKTNTYEELELIGSGKDSFGTMMPKVLGLEDGNINIGTFVKVKTEFDKFINAFSYSNTNSGATIKLNNAGNILAAGKYVDIAKFDNVIYEDEIVVAYNIVNKLIFNYDVKNEEMLYDYPTINVTMNVSENNGTSSADLTIELLNDYDEKVVYNVKITK